MPAERCTLAEVEVIQAGNLLKFFLQTLLRNEGKDGLKLTLTNANELWEGEISEADLDKLSKRLKMDFNTFVQHTVCALTCENQGTMSFEYQLKPISASRVQLSWKKYVPADDIKFQLGQVLLEKNEKPKHAMGSIFQQCINLVSDLKHKAQTLEVDNERLALERQNALKRLDKCVTAKEQLELDLYSKFVAVLNSKKEMIRILQEQSISEDGSKSPVAGPSNEDMTGTSRISSRTDNGHSRWNRQTIESQQEDTDDEIVTPPKKQSRQTTKLIDSDTSLALGDEEEMEAAKTTPAMRRTRKQIPGKKQSPMTIVPRKSSTTTERPSSAGRRTSLRKSGSQGSNKSYDPDDLLDNM